MKNKPSNTPTEAASVPVPQKRTVFTDEFKLAAVKRLKEGQQSATALALELGVRRTMLYKWAQALEQSGQEGRFKSRGRKPAEQESEVERLRRQLADAKMELEILKKFDAYLKQLKRKSTRR
jgi:transposase